MKSHPGGEAHSRRLISLAELSRGERVLDMGAGAGETLSLLRSLGCEARGIDRAPRSPEVERGDFLCAPYPDGSFDAVISQCAFFVSGDQAGALREAYRLLRPGGKLLLSDLFFVPPETLLGEAGFALRHAENLTAQWREYYLEALWRDEQPCCEIPKGKGAYWLLIAGKDGKNGSL